MKVLFSGFVRVGTPRLLPRAASFAEAEPFERSVVGKGAGEGGVSLILWNIRVLVAGTIFGRLDLFWKRAMSDILLAFVLVIALLLLNGLLAMSEFAVVTARRARLARQAESGDARAAVALELAANPAQFLSTVQVGITLVGILAGAFGGATISEELATLLAEVPTIAPYAEGIAFTAVVVLITYLSLIIGELAPKRIALGNPERVARMVAVPMRVLSRAGRPVVRFLTASTNLVMRLVGLHLSEEVPVSDEDVRALVAQGRAAGGIPAAEEKIVERVLRLGDRPVTAIMTPRTEVDWIELKEDPAAIRELLLDKPHSYLLVCQGTVDNVIGIVQTRDLLCQFLNEKPLDIPAVLAQPLFIPEMTSVLRLLEMFRQANVSTATVLDEFGGVQGLVTASDIFRDLVGDLPGSGGAPQAEPEIVARAEGGWLVDGAAPVEDLEKELGFTPAREEREHAYRTVGGLVLTELGHLPRIGESVQVGEFRFEVVDLDGRRIDRVLVTRTTSTE